MPSRVGQNTLYFLFVERDSNFSCFNRLHTIFLHLSFQDSANCLASFPFSRYKLKNIEQIQTDTILQQTSSQEIYLLKIPREWDCSIVFEAKTHFCRSNPSYYALKSSSPKFTSWIFIISWEFRRNIDYVTRICSIKGHTYRKEGIFGGNFRLFGAERVDE